jgi:hypothetical protein
MVTKSTKEKIISIAIDGVSPSNGDTAWGGYEGIQIKTTKQTIVIGVSSGASCCEQFGSEIFHTAPMDDLIGATINLITDDVSKIDESLLPEGYKSRYSEYGYDAGDEYLVYIDTSKGLIILQVYNSHNGYYGHSAFFESNDLNWSGTL